MGERLRQTDLGHEVRRLLDKVSALLGYGYPGGARLERLAREYPDITPTAHYCGDFKLPVPMRGSGDLNFSYSGLKTAVIRAVRLGDMAGTEQIPEDQHPSLLAALFAAVVESLWIKVSQAVEEHGVELVTVSGGVAINGFIRDRFQVEANRMGIGMKFPGPAQCLDNADMMAWLLNLTVAAGIPPAPFDADSNWNPGIPR